MPPTKLDHLTTGIPRTSYEAWALLAFGFRCVLSTPLGGCSYPCCCFTGEPTIDAAFWLVGSFLSGRPCLHELEQAEEAVFRAAVSKVGLYRDGVTGPAAAYWAVSWLVQAALATADERRLGHVQGITTLVARLCRQVEPARATEAAAFQARLAQEFLLPGPADAAKVC